MLGQDQAALIDTGMGIGSLLSIVRSITSLPLVVVNTHGHPDHAGGNVEFSHVFFTWVGSTQPSGQVHGLYDNAKGIVEQADGIQQGGIVYDESKRLGS